MTTLRKNGKIIYNKASMNHLINNLTVKNFHEDGEYTEMYKNGQLAYQMYYKDNKLDGSYKSWYENGQLRSQAYYKDDKLYGAYKQWMSNGKLDI